MPLKKIILKGEQRRVLFLPPEGAVLIRGVAGSGKTTVALYRAKHLLDNYSMMFNEANVVIFTYNRVLRNYIKALSKVIQGGYKKDEELPNISAPAGMKVEIDNFHSWAFNFLKVHGLDLTDKLIENSDRIKLIKQIKDSFYTHDVSKKEVQFFDVEFSWIKGKMYLDEETYINNPRTGRGTVDRITAGDKHIIWQMFDKYNKQLKQLDKFDFDDFAILCYQFLEKHPKYKPFTHIIVDEAQDLTKAQLMVISRLVSDKTNSITIIADAAQRINKSGFSWHEVGLDIKSARSLELNKNYRNTVEILEAAKSLLDQDTDKTQYTIGEAMNHGSKPVVASFSNFEDEVNSITKLIKKYKTNHEHCSAAILSTTQKNVNKLYEVCIKNGIKSQILKNNDDFKFEEDDVAICTMQSIKGLEFEFVIISDLNDFLLPNRYQLTGNPDDDEDNISTARRLLYTCMTRAQNYLFLLSSGQPTRYLKELNKDTYKQSSI